MLFQARTAALWQVWQSVSEVSPASWNRGSGSTSWAGVGRRPDPAIPSLPTWQETQSTPSSTSSLPEFSQLHDANTVRDLARKRAAGIDRFAVTTGSAGEGGEGEAPIARIPDTGSRSPEEAAIRHEMIACYLDYVGQLAPSYYEVYLLSEFEHLANDEVARRLGLSLPTVKIRLHRARARLYDELRRNCRCYVDERGELMGEPRGAKGETS